MPNAQSNPPCPVSDVPSAAAQDACPGLVWAFRIRSDGTAEELAECPLTDADRGRSGEGWLWLHVNLADARVAPYLRVAALDVPLAALDLLLSADDHQQLHADGACVYGVFADLVYRLGGPTDDLGRLHFVATDKLLLTGRRDGLNALEAVRRSLRAGTSTKTQTELLETILLQVVAGVEAKAEDLGDELDAIEERLIVDLTDDIPKRLARTRRLAVRLHRLLATQRAAIGRFEQNVVRMTGKAHDLRTVHIAQRLDWLDHEVIALRDRAHLLQEEISLRMTDQTNRNLHLLTIVTTVLLPASVVSSIFGMNVGGLPLAQDRTGFVWSMLLLVGASALVFWVLRRLGMLRR